ncbi:MAG: uroporphyrinogen-III C-methyltransferase [Zoogloeaceae bacterium]|jgi:uroporphyrin-3 C-methyltransferase|nr:uroporphyrinogen-III C-methyltransferase [Zoogloeaceae bacterium]
MNAKTQLPMLPSPTRRFFWRGPWFWIVLALLSLSAWQWLETRAALLGARQEMAQRLVEGERLMQESRALADKAMRDAAELQRKYGALEARLSEFQDQANALQSLYQEAAVSRDDAVLAEVEQNVNIAVQHLQLSGNIPAAIFALQAADQRLVRLEPRFLALRRALARDLERLRGTAFVDVTGMNLRLENVISGIDHLPLALDNVSAPPTPDVGEVEETAWWRAFAREAWKEIRGLVRVQRFDQQSPELLSPDQGRILRENLKLRLLNARLALLSRDQWTFRSELAAAEKWLERYFNADAKATQSAQLHLRQLLATEIAVALPTLHESLAAIQNAKASREQP